MKNTVKKSITMILASAMTVSGMIGSVNAASIEKTNTETVYGDLNFNGVADITDLSALSLYIIGDCKLDEAALKSADLNRDGKADLADLAELKMHLSKHSGNAVNAGNKEIADSRKTAVSFKDSAKYSGSDNVLKDGPLYDKINEQAEKLRAEDIYAMRVEAEFGVRRPVTVFRPLNYADGSYLDVYMAAFESKIEPECVTPYMFDTTTGEQISISDIFGDSFSEFDGGFEIIESNRNNGYVVLRNVNDYDDYGKAEYDFDTLNPEYSSFSDFQSLSLKYEEHELTEYRLVTITNK